MVRFFLPRPTSHVHFFHLYLCGENFTKLNVGKKNQLINEKTQSFVNNFKVPLFFSAKQTQHINLRGVVWSFSSKKPIGASTPWCSTAAVCRQEIPMNLQGNIEGYDWYDLFEMYT